MLAIKPQTAPCPYCYNRIDPKKVMYRCTGKPAPGRPRCVRAEDPERVAQLADATPVYPAFTPERSLITLKGSWERPRCSGPTSILFARCAIPPCRPTSPSQARSSE